MGSHLHLLIESMDLPHRLRPKTANILMSYNNKAVTEAIPVPGLGIYIDEKEF